LTTVSHIRINRTFISIFMAEKQRVEPGAISTVNSKYPLILDLLV
jgi:hypothetical protein